MHYSGFQGLTVGEIMTPRVHSLPADATVKDAARFFLDHEISGAPVVAETGRAVGVLTLRDLTGFLERHLEVEDTTDLLHQELRDLRREVGISDLYLERLNDLRVEQIMTPRVLSVHDDLGIERAVRFMTNERVHRVFVTDDEGTLIGVLSASDIMRAIEPPKKANHSVARRSGTRG